MTRHSKNSTANAVYTYHEKHKDSATGGYGTAQMRLSKDAIKEFDCCNFNFTTMSRSSCHQRWVFI